MKTAMGGCIQTIGAIIKKQMISIADHALMNQFRIVIFLNQYKTGPMTRPIAGVQNFHFPSLYIDTQYIHRLSKVILM